MAFVQNNLLNLIPVICHLSTFQKTGRPPNCELLLHLNWKSSQWLTQHKLTLRPLYKPSLTSPQLFPQEEPSRTTKCITWTTAHFVYMWCFHGDVIWITRNPSNHGNRIEEAVQGRMMAMFFLPSWAPVTVSFISWVIKKKQTFCRLLLLFGAHLTPWTLLPIPGLTSASSSRTDIYVGGVLSGWASTCSPHLWAPFFWTISLWFISQLSIITKISFFFLLF